MGIYKILDAYPEDIQIKGKKILTSYVEQVVNKEWPAMKRGDHDSKAYYVLDDFHKLIIRQNLSNYAELAAQQQELKLLADYRNLRLNRLSSAKPMLDTPMYLSLLLGAVIFIFYHCLYSMKNLRLHAVMILLLATSLGLVYFLILAYNNPFVGPNSIPPDEFRFVLGFWDKSR